MIIKFEPMGRQVEVDSQETVMAVAVRENLPVRSDCGGKGTCGKCRVVLDPAENASPPSDTERKMLSVRELDKNVRLACQAKVQGPLTATIPKAFMDADAATGKGLCAAHPIIRGSVSSSDLLSTEGKAPGDRTSRSLGLAVDIGTTTVAAYLCDLRTGIVLASEATANPQRRYGEDVISRISFAGKAPGNTGLLQHLAAETVSGLAARCVELAGASRRDIHDVTIVGNPTMEQIFRGADPQGLGKAPFRPQTRDAFTFDAGTLKLGLSSGTPVYLFPVVSGFVGGDTLGAVLADGTHRREETTLLVDIGTNGELVMGNRDGLWAASCATGPAFEGAQISRGMRAVPGAITRVDFHELSGKFSWEVMNGRGPSKPMGLCGSGIIDAVAAMRRAGILLENGSFRKDIPGVIYDGKGVGREYLLVPGAQSHRGAPITVTLGDIRQIQLAKGALALGIELLTHQVSRKADRIVLTGAFGARFDWQNAFAIGMLPACVADARVIPMDNLAGVGAILTLMDEKARRDVEDLSQCIRHVDLAKEPGFHTGLAKHMMFTKLEKI